MRNLLATTLLFGLLACATDKLVPLTEDAGGDDDAAADPPAAPDAAPDLVATLVGAGDIAGCEGDGDEKTSALLDQIPGTIFLAGDIAYDDGTEEEFAECFHPSWGRHKPRMRPAPGNHEYYNGDRGDGAPYFDYFGSAAGNRGEGWYSYDLGRWHVVVLNSNCDPEDPKVDCAAGSAQETWLRADLAAHPTDCTLAYFHHPLFSSGDHGANAWMKDLWTTLHAGGVDVILSGHDHNYERFAPQDADGDADPEGTRSFIVGTGGRSHYEVNDSVVNSEMSHSGAFGLLKLTLRPESYDWEFIAVETGAFTDSGSDACRNTRRLD